MTERAPGGNREGRHLGRGATAGLGGECLVPRNAANAGRDFDRLGLACFALLGSIRLYRRQSAVKLDGRAGEVKSLKSGIAPAIRCAEEVSTGRATADRPCQHIAILETRKLERAGEGNLAA